MKKFLILLIALYTRCYSQSLEGTWKGQYIAKRISSNGYNVPVNIRLEVKRTITGTYEMTTCTVSQVLDDKPDTSICRAVYQGLSQDSFLLQEVQLLKATFSSQPCFQKMWLKITEE